MNRSKKHENLLVILLTMNSGCADAISFLALGQVLTAAMTGNTVFLGLSVVHAGGMKPLGFLVALLAFALGVAVGAVLLRKKSHVTGLNPVVSYTLCLELAAFILFGIVSSAVDAPNQLLLITILAFAMGVQGIAARRIGVNGVPTTVITSTTTGLIESLIWNVYNLAKGNSISKSEVKMVPSSSILIWITDIIIYGVGAALCGALEMRWNLHAIWLPTVIVLVVVLWSVFAQRQANQKNNKQLKTSA